MNQELIFLNDNEIKCLDKGYLRLLEVGGSDAFMAKFARCSFQNQDLEPDPKKDSNLIDHLVRNRHTSPLEAGEMWFQAKMPLFVRDQLVRHRTLSLNIQSLRYSEHDGEYYVPEVDRLKFQDAFNKQGSGEKVDEEVARNIRELIIQHSELSYERYNNLVKYNLARESARMLLPTNFYTVVCFKCDTKNLLNLLSLRDDVHAQEEIQALAKAIAYFFKREFPDLYDSYIRHIKESVTFSKDEQVILVKMMTDSSFTPTSDDFEKTSLYREFMAKLEKLKNNGEKNDN